MAKANDGLGLDDAERAARHSYALVRALNYRAKLERLPGNPSADVTFDPRNDCFTARVFCADPREKGAVVSGAVVRWPFDVYPPFNDWQNVRLVERTVYED